ncbi:MAG: hypothetical protein CXT73_05240 [Methanobacteriota archaeon]|nr:MAG: hypothetical protein CXT73_05240 [Euryarchaeota archaeon]
MNTLPESEDPELMVLTTENRNEFLVWVLTQLWEKNLHVDDEFLNYYMELKIEDWVNNSYTWVYCYTCVIDELELQKKNEEKKLKQKEKEKIRPTDIQKRRELFASKYENKFNTSKFKKKKNKKN